MRFDIRHEPITDDDEVIRAGVADGPLPAVLAAVAHLTGDLSILRDEFRPILGAVLDPNFGLTAETVAAGRDAAAAALARYRDAGSVPARLDEAAIGRILDFVAGGQADPRTVPLMREELSLDGEDRRAPGWDAASLAPGRVFCVGIVGAGMSGIAAAHRLRQAGVEVVVLDKNADVGGTWFENEYPGCRVDIQTHFYSYSFAQTEDWPQYYSRQRVLQEYFAAVVDRFGLREHIRFSTEVTHAGWDDTAQQWVVSWQGTGSRHGEQGQLRVDALVSATGQLNRPLFPDIPGVGDFAGPSFHSARWDHTVDLDGRRVAVIGTGASAVQFIPHVAEQASHTTVFQRTPPWVLPVEIYQADIPASLRWLSRHVPQYPRWDRLWIVVRTQEGLLPYTEVDPAWTGGDASVGAQNEMMRQMMSLLFEAAVADPALREQLTPRYPPFAKRMAIDDGTYLAALQRPDVSLVTLPIERITPGGVRTVDGIEHEADVLIYGTGFQASNFLTPMRVTGRAGADLHEQWGGDARAHLGITVPGFPNLFLMYGPNTNIVVNGSIIYFSECEARYIVESVRMLLERGLGAMDCRREAHDAYNERIDAGNRARAWGASNVNAWYKNAFGRVSQNWPFNLVTYWEQTRAPDPNDYELTPLHQTIGAPT